MTNSYYVNEQGLLAVRKPEADAHQANSGLHQPPRSGICQPLANVSTFEDLKAANRVAQEAGSTQRINSTRHLGSLQGPEYNGAFELSQSLLNAFGSSENIDGLMAYFEHYNVPLGLLAKLANNAPFSRVSLIVDDSGSTRAETDALVSAAHPFLKARLSKAESAPMTRFEEIESRIHYMIDLLAFYPGLEIDLSFLNEKSFNQTLSNRRNLSPGEFAEEMHESVHQAFSSIYPKYKTPIRPALANSFSIAESKNQPTHHFLFTDGKPTDPHEHETDEEIEAIIHLIEARHNQQQNPITLLSCSNQDHEVEWLKRVEAAALFCSESDDQKDERHEVLKDQGPAFPFTEGFWLLNQLCASTNPHDLDKMDENLPFTKHTLQDILGRTLSNAEYRYYFDLNPHAKLYRDLYQEFQDREQFAEEIVSLDLRAERETLAGYIEYSVEENILPGHEYQRNSRGEVVRDKFDRPKIEDDSKAMLYAFLPLSRHTYTKLYHPEIEGQVASAQLEHRRYGDEVIRRNQACCLFKPNLPPEPAPIPSAYVSLEEYRQYFNSLPAVQEMSDNYKTYLFNLLKAEQPHHAHDLLEDFEALHLQKEGNFQLSEARIRQHNTSQQVNTGQVHLEIAGGFSLPATSGGVPR